MPAPQQQQLQLQHCDFQQQAASLQDICAVLTTLGCDMAIAKLLPKNANDKNQVYFASDYGLLHRTFNLQLADRGAGTSSKGGTSTGRRIVEAVFQDFSWVKSDLSTVAATGVRAIVYPQYPEARLSGFQTVDYKIPRALCVEFTKQLPDASRMLVLGRRPGGACVALLYVDLPASLRAEILALPGLEGSRVCKLIELAHTASGTLLSKLARIVGTTLPGCKLAVGGATQPFTGTQVCGYTLEHALGIAPNSDMDGDFMGIELKTHTQPKVSLITTEPDFGIYAESFTAFMNQFGYTDSEGNVRLTGVHRANVRNGKTGLMLRVREYRLQSSSDGEAQDWIRNEDGSRKAFRYDAATALTSKMDAVEVVLETADGVVAAGWSLERLMNNWGVKHNEAVFISASKALNSDATQRALGYEWSITFSPRVIWCRNTSAERLLTAIDEGTIFLDPAPKLVPGDPRRNKRRCQWRVNDVENAVHRLYDQVEIRNVVGTQAAAPAGASEHQTGGGLF